jgi:hypothetical protein
MGLDLEMAFDSHYHEVLDLLDELLLTLFKELKTTFRPEVETVRKQFPTEEFLIPDKTVRLQFHEAIAMLREAGATDEEGNQLGDLDDLSCVPPLPTLQAAGARRLMTSALVLLGRPTRSGSAGSSGRSTIPTTSSSTSSRSPSGRSTRCPTRSTRCVQAWADCCRAPFAN